MGALDLLTRQVAAIAGCYLVTYGICLALSRLLGGMPDIAAAIWGFHFIIGAGVAMLVRPLLASIQGRAGGESPIHGPTLGRVSGLTIDVMTCAALAAIEIAVPVLLFLIPGVVASWPESYPAGGWIGLGLCAGYMVVLLVLWRYLAPLRFRRPRTKLWSEER